MDRNSSLLRPVKVETLPISTPTLPSLGLNLIKQEQLTVYIPPLPFIDSINELLPPSNTTYIAGAPPSMDRNSSLLLPVKVENLPMSTPNPPSPESNLIRQNINTVNIPPPPFVDSINELRSFSTALSTFLRRYDELHDHLNLIKSSIDSKLPNHLPYTANPNQSKAGTFCTHSITAVPETTISEQNPNATASNHEETDASKKPEEIDNLKKLEEIATFKKLEEIATFKKLEGIVTSKKSAEIDTLKKLKGIITPKKPEGIITSKNPEEIVTSKKPAVSDIESLCKRIRDRDLKKYVLTHISDTKKIREELPKALKLAKNPAKLVLDSIGKFFLQKSKSYLNQSINDGRTARVLILECFVIISSDITEITKKDMEDAAKTAGDWKNRMINEGELDTANEMDARGLLLLISGFGIPENVFGNKDIRDLIKASNVSGIYTSLRRSVILIRKAPELIEWMVKNNMEIEAADFAYTLGLEDKCQPETILTTFFHNKIKNRQQTYLSQIKHQLSDLKSLSKCLESHNMDPLKLFPGFKINEKIQELEKEEQKLELLEATTQKRKAEQKPKEETKRSRVNMPHQQKTGGYGGPVVDHMANGGPHGSQTYFPQPSLGQFRTSGREYVESFPGMPRRGPVSDLYGFADKL